MRPKLHRVRTVRLLVRLVMGLFLVVVAVACTDGTRDATAGEPDAPPTSAPEPTLDTSSERVGNAADGSQESPPEPTPQPSNASTPPSPGAALPTIDDLWGLAEATVALPRMSFDLEVTMTLPGTEAPLVALRTGSFDDDSFSGVGTRSFETQNAQISELWGDEPFEFRFIGQTLWMYNPLGQPPSWGGFDVFEFADFAGGDPLGSVDGDGYLGVVAAATTEVLDVQLQADGSKIWLLQVRADDFVPVVAAGGPASRLIGLGAAESGLQASVELVQDPEGYFAGFTVDLSEWWTNAIGLAALTQGGESMTVTQGGESMTVEFRLEPFDGPLIPEVPCENPSTTVDDDGLTILVCAP